MIESGPFKGVQEKIFSGTLQRQVDGGGIIVLSMSVGEKEIPVFSFTPPDGQDFVVDYEWLEQQVGEHVALRVRYGEDESKDRLIFYIFEKDGPVVNKVFE